MPSAMPRREGAAAAQSPNAPSTWIQASGFELADDRDALPQRVERAAVHVAGLQTDDRRAVNRRDGFAKRRRQDPALVVHVNPSDASRTQPIHPDRVEQRDVRVRAGHDRDLGRPALQTQSLDIPAGPRQHLVTTDGDAHEIGHRPAGHEADGRAGRQPEQLDEPLAGDALHDGRRRRRDRRRRILVPDGRQPVRRDGRRQATAENEAEEPRSGHRNEAGRDLASEQFDDVGRVFAMLRQRAAQRGCEVVVADRWPHRPIGQGLPVRDRVLGRTAEQLGRAGVGIGGCFVDARLDGHGRDYAADAAAGSPAAAASTWRGSTVISATTQRTRQRVRRRLRLRPGRPSRLRPPGRDPASGRPTRRAGRRRPRP